MKKIFGILVVVVLIVGVFAACGEKEPAVEAPPAALAETEVAEDAIEPEETSEEAPVEETAPANGEAVKIGIIQLVQHGALDAANQGFIEGLAEAGYVDGENITIDYQNAQGEITNTSTIASKFVNDESDIILAIATPAAQAVANATEDIPILFTAVTDAVDAGLVETNEVPGGNITGTSDLTPVKEQIGLLQKIFPEAKTVGVIFSSNEPNSRVQADIAKEAIEAAGMTYEEYTVSEPHQIQQVVQTAVSQVDVIYTPTDNTIASAMVQVSTIAAENDIAVIGAEESQVENGALVTYGISYYELGKITAGQAVQIIEGTDPGAIPVGYQTEYVMTVNEERLEELGLTLPEL